ncbi:protein bric-a-brac 2-like isoform X3 [Leptidea sinapis]|uniref:protein bric-a-brac 2-like isoform X3 n=1 Tax=Leptidea sinapis TaxID=189913 RepID=UPI00213C2EFA|nr:protein bric-a-brac 2-like isoform X3 [Leptidea sinapis]
MSEDKMAVPPQQFCVRWNSYHTNLQSVFPRLLLTEQFADVTLACESRQLRCHKLVLSACSAYLEKLLLQNPCKHPIVLMRDMRFSEMQALVDFMYKGEVNVTQEELPSLLKSAEALQIRGLCSSDPGSLSELKSDSKDYAVASEALVAHAQRDATESTQQKQTNGPKKHKTEERERCSEVKEETVEEDGLYYGELDQDHMEYNEEEETSKPGSSLGQTSEFAIANVQCQYDGSDSEGEHRGPRAPSDHNYDTRDEPPAFIIQQVSRPPQSTPPQGPYVEVTPAIMTIGPGYVPSVNVIHVGDRPPTSQSQPEFSINKRIRRSEVVLRQAAECVSKGLTFQTVSEQFNIPISTIRFFMARKGILPRRRRGRTTHLNQQSPSPEPLFHMQHFKLPDMIGFPDEDQPSASDKATE